MTANASRFNGNEAYQRAHAAVRGGQPIRLRVEWSGRLLVIVCEPQDGFVHLARKLILRRTRNMISRLAGSEDSLSLSLERPRQTRKLDGPRALLGLPGCPCVAAPLQSAQQIPAVVLSQPAFPS